jgi:hypothetical protein
MSSSVDAPPSASPPRRRARWIAGIAAVLVAILVLPYLRQLFWLHARSALPESYVLPLPGLLVRDLEPNFGGPRAHGPHEGIDLLAPAGTPVLSVADGIVIDDRETKIGGKVLWILGSGARLYYYAHLQDRAERVSDGAFVAAGQTIASVGTTGNAAGGPPHLHFAIYQVTSAFYPLRYLPLDPYPLLVARGRPPPPLEAAEAEPSKEMAPDEIPLRVVFRDTSELRAAAIAEEAQRAADRLAVLLRGLDPFLGVDADADARRVRRIYALPGSLRERAAGLAARLGADASVRLGDSDPEVRELGARVHRSIERLERLMDRHESCAHQNLAPFLSALETFALEVELAAEAPAPAEPEPQLEYFVFAGQPPGVVPRAGGWLLAVGPGLGSGGPLRADLAALDRPDVLTLLETRDVADDDAVAVRVPEKLLDANALECMRLRLHPPRSNGVLPWRTSSAPGPLELPICVPEASSSAYRIAGFLSYRVRIATRVLESDELLFFNTECEERLEVSRSLEWPLEPGGRLTETGDSELYAINDSSVECRIEENRIHCSGWLGPASCEEGPGSEPRQVDTEWHHIFSPTEEYPEREHRRSTALAAPVELGAEPTRTCVEVPRDAVTEETDMWFDLFAVNANQQRSQFSSPRIRVTEPTHRRFEVGAHRIEAELDPVSTSEHGEICVTLHAPDCTP